MKKGNELKTILFGAGASVDESIHGRVPLTRELFEILRSCKDNWKNLSQKWAKEFKKKPFEEAMQMLLNEAFDDGGFHSGSKRVDFRRLSQNPELRRWSDLQWDLAEYFYLSHIIKNDSLYIKFLDKIKSHYLEFQIATLNYDTLLFQALKHVKLVSPEISSACPIPICIPHGSSFLYCAKPNFKRGNDGYGFYNGQLAGIDPFNVDEDLNDVEIKVFKSKKEFYDRRMDSFPPIMCYIEPDKRIKIGKKFIQAEQKKWKCWVQSSDLIVIIGVSINSADRHIWKPLEDTSAAILYVSGSNARNNFDSWCKKCGRSNPKDNAIDKKWVDGQREIFEFLNLNS